MTWHLYTPWFKYIVNGWCFFKCTSAAIALRTTSSQSISAPVIIVVRITHSPGCWSVDAMHITSSIPRAQSQRAPCLFIPARERNKRGGSISTFVGWPTVDYSPRLPYTLSTQQHSLDIYIYRHIVAQPSEPLTIHTAKPSQPAIPPWRGPTWLPLNMH